MPDPRDFVEPVDEGAEIIESGAGLGGERPLEVLAGRAAGCRMCGLWRDATQTVLGEGPASASMVLVGEQPGEKEDLAGRPFVGPAGRLMDEALGEAGIDRTEVYVTNAVKHFKFRRQGPKRLHETPNQAEVVACHPWLAAELEVLEPDVVVTLGATAGKSIFGPSFRVGASRGSPIEHDGHLVVATIHPSAVLRLRTSDDRDAAFGGLVADLRLAAEVASFGRST